MFYTFFMRLIKTNILFFGPLIFADLHCRLCDLWVCFLVVRTMWPATLLSCVLCKRTCTVMLFMNIMIKKKKKRLMMQLGFISWKALCHWARHTMSHSAQTRICHSRTLSTLGGLLGTLLLLHWQPLSFHLWDEALPGLDLPQTDGLLISDQGLDVLEEDIDLCPLLLQMPPKHVRRQRLRTFVSVQLQ